MTEQLRGHLDELDPDTLGGFHVRWYKHAGAQPIGPFGRMDEVASYMTEHGLDTPDEFLAPIT
ncbi:hypothetical protein [Streptomyces noursei]|uniref:hypothetical protein n=1 Tax=Streptomyces noursei TaxID=1971 RepID=UPI001679D579|nr:hypothetical protein [Streptomyces noursei]MCZ1013955.1 hypothetical protein [Streptomyces noursei]GGX40606.1 hypothetical protein GCM10010341_73180 [Streptomyces noursei]